MGKYGKIILALVVLIVVVGAVYFYALPKGSIQPKSALSAKVLHHSTKNVLKFTPAKTKVTALASKTVYIQQGLDSAPKKFYAILDPNCIFCHRLFELVQPAISKGELAVRWIVIGAVRPSSPAKAKAILASPSPIAALRANEAGFNEKIEEGGIAPAYSVPKKALDAFNTNMNFAQSVKLQFTPVIFFHDPAGQFVRFDGGVPESKLNAFLSHVGSKF